MMYLGGKARIANKLTEYINNRLKPNQTYWEPFVGAGWVISKIDDQRIRMGSDIHKELIAMWKALQEGRKPPKKITEEEYYDIKNGNYSLALKGFTGFACSWGGKWWGGYACNGSDRNYALNGYNSLTKKIPLIQSVDFFCADYKSVNPLYNTFIYCDPPYYGTTEYKNKFDSIEFWEWVRNMTKKGHIVLASEYQAPPDFTCVWSIETKTDIRNKNKEKIPRIEKLFEYIIKE